MSSMILLLNPNLLSDENPISLIVSYTDIYHQSSEFYKNITYNIYIFSAFPPLFDKDLPQINATRCSNASFELPTVTDPQGLSWNISLDSNGLPWISLNNSLINLETSNLNYDIAESNLVVIKIENEKHAWTNYNLTINVTPYQNQSFSNLHNISITYGDINKFIINRSLNTSVSVVDWTGKTLSWILYNVENSSIIVNATNIFPSINWVKLWSYDECGDEVSDSFNITVTLGRPPAALNILGPLIVFVGEEKLFLLPHDLFVSTYNLTYFLNVINCTTDSYLDAHLEKSTKYNELYLFIYGKHSKAWSLSITATDPLNQSAQIIVGVIIKEWASKDWIKWTNEYDSSWTGCKTGMYLSDSGVWFETISYLPKFTDKFYSIWGIIVMVVLIVYLLMWWRLGLNTFASYEFAQTLILFISSMHNTNENLQNFTVWFQFAKLDLGFINQFNLLKAIGCQTPSAKMTSIQFYWKSTILNYFFLILTIWLFISFVFIMKLRSKRSNWALMIYNHICSKIRKESIAWIIIHAILPFIWINIIYDSINTKSQPILSSILFMILIIWFFAILINAPQIYTLTFLSSIDKWSPISFTYLTLAKIITHAWLFTFESYIIHTIFIISEYVIYLLI